MYNFINTHNPRTSRVKNAGTGSFGDAPHSAPPQKARSQSRWTNLLTLLLFVSLALCFLMPQMAYAESISSDDPIVFCNDGHAGETSDDCIYDPADHGPYEVGTIHFAGTDDEPYLGNSRICVEDSVTGEPKLDGFTNCARNVEFRIWFPVDPDDAGNADPAIGVFDLLAGQDAKTPDDMPGVNNVVTVSFPGVVLDNLLDGRMLPVAKGKFPLVVKGSGNLSIASSSSLAAGILASHGFIVVGIGIDENNLSDLILDTFLGDREVREQREIDNHIAAIDLMLSLNEDEASQFHKTIKKNQIAYWGNSGSGNSLYFIAQEDERVIAAVDERGSSGGRNSLGSLYEFVDGEFFPLPPLTEGEIPVLFFTGSADYRILPEYVTDKYEDYSGKQKVLVNVDGYGHSSGATPCSNHDIFVFDDFTSFLAYDLPEIRVNALVISVATECLGSFPFVPLPPTPFAQSVYDAKGLNPFTCGFTPPAFRSAACQDAMDEIDDKGTAVRAHWVVSFLKAYAAKDDRYKALLMEETGVPLSPSPLADFRSEGEED